MRVKVKEGDMAGEKEGELGAEDGSCDCEEENCSLMSTASGS